MRLAFVAAVALGLSLAGCANWEGFRDEQAQYIGKPVDQMYGEWGAPRNSAPLSDGGTYYDFRGTRNGGYVCEVGAWTDARGIVTRINVGGMNGCVMP